MSFVFPSFLWALLTLSIPLAIHLFNFRRTRRVFFTNVHLLREVKTETNYFRRLKHLLILICRLAFLAFLVLAFAQPYFASKNAQNIKGLQGIVSLYLDNSYSMQSELGNEKYLSMSMTAINDLLKVFPKSAQFQLITNNFENKEQYPVSSQEISDRLTETDYSNAYRDLTTLHKRQLNLLDRFSPNRKNQIFWFSDFQKSTLGELNKIQLDTLNQYYLVPIKSEKTPNLRIDSVWLENPFIKALESNQIKVRLRSFSQEPYENLALKLFLDDKQVSTASVKITVEGKGLKKCKITFEDFPVTFDNEYYFSINASPTIQILHLTENSLNRYIPNLFGNESVFNLQSFSVRNLDYNRIKTAELILLDGVESVEGELSTALQERVRKGASLMIFPSAKGANSLNGFLTSLSIAGLQSIRSDSLGRGKNNELALLESQNPFFRGVFERVPSNMNMPYANATLRWQNVGENLLTFKNRQPFLSRFNTAQGKVYLCASPLDADYTGFPKHAIFVPIMYRIASLSKTGEERLAYSFQEKTIRVKLDKPTKNQVYKLVKDKVEIVPPQRILGEELILELPEQSLTAGFYELKLDNNTVAILAFNYDKAESEMNFYSAQELQSAFAKQKNVQIYDILKNKNFIQDFQEKNLQVNLWKYMLIFALVFLLLEIALIRLM
jgi:Aerotolerance regulator N-terminal